MPRPGYGYAKPFGATTQSQFDLGLGILARPLQNQSLGALLTRCIYEFDEAITFAFVKADSFSNINSPFTDDECWVFRSGDQIVFPEFGNEPTTWLYPFSGQRSYKWRYKNPVNGDDLTHPDPLDNSILRLVQDEVCNDVIERSVKYVFDKTVEKNPGSNVFLCSQLGFGYIVGYFLPLFNPSDNSPLEHTFRSLNTPYLKFKFLPKSSNNQNSNFIFEGNS